VRDAFYPVGLMLDFWAETVTAGTEQNVKIYVINDLEPEWKGELRLLLLKGTDCVSARVANCQVKGFGREIVTIAQTMPASGVITRSSRNLQTVAGAPYAACVISRSSRQAERGKDARNVGFLWKTKLGWGRIQRINHIARDEPVTYSTLRAYASQ